MNANAAAMLTNPTAGYRPSGLGYANLLSWVRLTEPMFTWGDIPLMQRDPAVKYGLRMLRSPFPRITIAKDRQGNDKISGRPAVQRYIKKTWARFWRHSVPRLLSNYFKWGRAPGGAEWSYDPAVKQLTLSQVRAVEPNDAQPFVKNRGRRKGELAGFQLNGAGSSAFVGRCHAFWFSGFDELGPFHDEPRLVAVHAPWLEKTGPTGVRAARRLLNWTRAVGITVIYYPKGNSRDGRGVVMDNENRAMRLGYSLQNGQVVALPNETMGDDSGNRQWAIEQREGQDNASKVNETIGDLHEEIWFGLGIPPEIIQAGGVGSGYEGRAIPMETFLGGSDEVAGMLDEAFRRQTLWHGIRANFGRQSWDYEITSLLREYLDESKNRGQGNSGGSGGGGNPSPPGLPSPQPDRRPALLSGLPADQGDDEGGDSLIRRQGGVTRAAAGIGRKEAQLRTAAALAMVESRLEELLKGSDSDDAADERDALAELADDPEEAADALGTVSLSWVAYGMTKGGKTKWKNSETNERRYQKSEPGTHAAKREQRQGNAKRGHEIVDKVARNEASADDLRELGDHLGSMTRDDLSKARQKLQAGFKSARQRDGMVAALRDHVAGRAAAIEGAKKLEPKPAPTTRENGTPEAPKNEDVHTVPTDALNVDPKRFQYKVSGIGEGGIGDELKGTNQWNPELGGTLLVWRDPTDGKDYVVNGHHRFDLAKRSGTKNVNARYIDAGSAKEARARGALANIAEGRGTAVDAAKYLRDSGQDVDHLQRAGISLSGKVAADAAHLKDLSPKAFQGLTEGRIDEGDATAVARNLKNHDLQDLLLKKLADRDERGEPKWSANVVAQAAKKMARAGTTTEKVKNLFGEFDDEKSTFEQEAELESAIGRKLAGSVGDFRALANKGRADRTADAGNVLNTDENKRRQLQAAEHAETFDREAGLSGPVSDAIKRHAADLAAAKGEKERKAVHERAYEEVRQLVGGGKPPQADAGGSGAGGSGGAKAPDVPPEPTAGRDESPAAPAPEVKPAAPPPMHATRATMHNAIDGNPNLTPEHREHMRAAATKVTARIPDAAHERIGRHLPGGARFYPDLKALSHGLYDEVLNNPKYNDATKAEVSKMKAKGVEVGGAYSHSDGSLHLNGGRVAGKPADHRPTHQLYAHELTHAIDGPKGELSKSPEWGEIMAGEIALPNHPLSRYASTQPKEGLAEFGRLVYGGDHDLAKVEKKFPRATAFFKARNLWPSSTTSSTPPTGSTSTTTGGTSTPSSPTPAGATTPRPVMLSGTTYNEDEHPRDDSGHWIKKGDIEAAKGDPEAAAELKAKTTDPAQRAKLDKALAGKPAHEVADHEGDAPTREKAANFIQRVAAKTAELAQRAHLLYLKLGIDYTDILDTPDDFTKLGMSPGMAFTGPQVHDPMRDALGVSTHFAMSILSKAMAAGFVAGKKLLKGKPAQPAAVQLSGTDDTVAELAGVLQQMLRAAVDEIGPGADAVPVPSVEKIAAFIRGKMAGGTA